MSDENVATQEGVTPETSIEADSDIVSRLSALIDEQERPPEEARQEEPPQAEPEPEPPARTLRVKIDGEEREVPVEEVVARYQKEASAEKRFEEAARTKREADDLASRITTERTQLLNAANLFIERAQTFGPKPPDPSMLDENPVEFIRQQQKFQEFQGQYAQAQAAKAYLDQQQKADETSRMNARIQTEQEKLMKAIPHWSDESKKSSEQAMVRDHLAKLGFDKSELEAIADHRLVVMARESALYQQLMSKAKETTKAVAKAPAKVERPGVATSNSDGRTQAAQRFQRSGRVEDAAALFRQMLGD